MVFSLPAFINVQVMLAKSLFFAAQSLNCHSLQGLSLKCNFQYCLDAKAMQNCTKNVNACVSFKLSLKAKYTHFLHFNDLALKFGEVPFNPLFK